MHRVCVAFLRTRRSAQCRRCSRTLEPTQASETVLYRYRFDESLRDRLYTQLAARGAIGDVLDGRGFGTAWDEQVVGASEVEYLLDLYATDEERGLAVIAAVAATPTPEDVIDLHGTSIDTDAYPIVVATSDRPDDVVSDLADHLDVGPCTRPNRVNQPCPATPLPPGPNPR